MEPDAANSIEIRAHTFTIKNMNVKGDGEKMQILRHFHYWLLFRDDAQKQQKQPRQRKKSHFRE
jgi:hypothetical protein